MVEHEASLWLPPEEPMQALPVRAAPDPLHCGRSVARSPGGQGPEKATPGETYAPGPVTHAGLRVCSRTALWTRRFLWAGPTRAAGDPRRRKGWAALGALGEGWARCPA